MISRWQCEFMTECLEVVPLDAVVLGDGDVFVPAGEERACTSVTAGERQGGDRQHTACRGSDCCKWAMQKPFGTRSITIRSAALDWQRGQYEWFAAEPAGDRWRGTKLKASNTSTVIMTNGSDGERSLCWNKHTQTLYIHIQERERLGRCHHDTNS